MAKYEISHPELPQLHGILELDDGVEPSEQHFWEAAKAVVRPYGASQLSDNAKIAAYKNGFFDTPSVPVLDVEDDPETIQNEEQPGMLSSLGDMVSKLGTRIDPLTSPYSKVLQLDDEPVAYDKTENLEQFRVAGKYLFGLLDNQESLSDLGFDPISEALKYTGMPFYAKNKNARGRVKAAAMDYATDNIEASAGMGMARAFKTPEFLLEGGAYLANKITLDEEDDEEILDFVNSAIGFDKVNSEYETAAELAAWVMDNPVDAIKSTVGVEPEKMSFGSQLEQDIRTGYQEPSEGVGLAFEIVGDPLNLAGAPVAKAATSPMRIGLKGRMLKTLTDVQQKTMELTKYQNILKKLPDDALVKGRVAQQAERVAGELAEQQKILQKYGSNSLHLRLMGKASPETLGKVAMETFDQSTDAGKMGMSLVQEATKASDQMSKLRRVANTAAKLNPEIAGATVGGLVAGPVGAVAGATIPTAIKVARLISFMPENVATRYIITAAQNAGEEITEQAARQRYRSYRNMVGTTLGLSSAAGFALDSDALGGGAGIAALSTLLGPKALSLFDNIARDARVVGSELTLARTGDHTPFFRRLSMLPTPDQGLAGATMDKFNILMKPGPEGLVSRVGDAIAQGGKASAKEVNPSAQPFRVGPGGEKIGQAPTISGATQKVANFLDKAGPLGRIGSPVESMGRFATGMAVGAAIPSSIGFVASGGQASGAVAGAVMSAPFTALGTGAGMYQNYKTKGDLYAKQIGDIQYYREHLTKNERAEFDALPANIRANVAGYSLSHPDVIFKQTSEGEGGFNPVTMEVSYNPNGTGYLKGTMAHEITHFMEVHGLTPIVNRILFGDQTTKTPGEFASFDKDGNIVYTDEFMQLRDIYMDRLRKDTSLDPDAVAEYESNPQKIGREIFADQGADFLLTGKREKALNQGPIGKIMQETLKGITGVSFLRDFLLKMNLPLNADGKFITSTDLFKGKLRKIPELQNLIEKYYKDVRGLKKAQIEGSEYTDPFTGKTRKEEGKKPIDDEFETLYSVEDQKNPNVVDKLNTGGIFKSNPQTGEIEKDALGNPIRMTKGEADKVSQAAGDHAADVLKRNGVEVETNDKGRPFVKDLPALSETVIDQLAKGPIHPRQLAALREISRALRAGDGERAGMLIGYYAATQGRKPKAVPFAVRTTMPYGFELTAQGNIMVRLHDVDQIQKNLKFLKGEKQPKKLPNELVGMYDELFGNDNAVWDAFALYRQNTANGIDGRTGLDADPVIANKKLNFLNALHGGITKSQVAMNPVLNAIGYNMAAINKKHNPFGPATKTFRLDRVFNAQRSAGNRASPVNEQRVINLMSPQGQKLYTPKPEADVTVTDKLFMPASEAGATKGKVAEAAKLWNEKGIDSPYFKKWFGESKVVDDNGEPLVVYHGTDKQFTSFDPEKSIGGQHWFTSDKSAIESGEVGAQGKGIIMETYLNIEKPAGWAEYDKFTIDELLGRGYDGLILPESDGTATYVAYSPEQIKSATGNRGTFDAGERNILFMPTQGDTTPASVQSWDGPNPTFGTNFTRGMVKDNKEAAALLRKSYEDQFGEPLRAQDFTEDQVNWLGDMFAKEGEAALGRTGNAVDWYTSAVERALAVAEEIFPDIGQKYEAKDRFLGALSITSQNMRVMDNAKGAVKQYQHKERTGKFDYSIKHGAKADAITKNLKLYDQAEAKMGAKDLHEFLDADFTVKELSEWGRGFFGDKKFSIAGYSTDMVKGSAIFGPKIGQGFFQNLRGNYNPVTVDLWLRRTFGRLTGLALDTELKPSDIGRLIYSVRKNVGKRKFSGLELPEFLKGVSITGKVQGNGVANFKISDQAYNRLFGDNTIGRDNYEAVYEFAGKLNKEWERRFATAGNDVTKAKKAIKAAKKEKKGTANLEKKLAKLEIEKEAIGKEKPQWAKAGSTVSDKLKPIDIPSNAERAVITKAFNVALKTLRDKGIDLTPADLQATLWYPEKDIWAFLKGENSDALNMSYDTAMEVIRDQR